MAWPRPVSYILVDAKRFLAFRRSIVAVHQSSVRPAEFWVYNATSGKVTQLTHSAIASLSAAAIPASQLVHYKSFDGKLISALAQQPRSYHPRVPDMRSKRAV
jgi:dipeptidyl aminopeptidase/acylaminoacyl peptidase